MQEIMNVLQGSQEAAHDREQFMKSVFLYWVMGATDGHAKNFSLRIEPQGRYQLSPIYDVISAYPLAAKRQLEWQALKMAMSLRGKSRHYSWHNIQARHWIANAEKCQFSSITMQGIIEQVFDELESVIDKVSQQLPRHFPANISEPIFSGMRKIKNRCL